MCDIIASADDDGLMSLTKDNFNKDATKNSEDSKEYVKFTLEDAIIPNDPKNVDNTDVDENEDYDEENE